MNNKRKNNTNRSLQKKNSFDRAYHTPKPVRIAHESAKNDKDIKEQMEVN